MRLSLWLRGQIGVGLVVALLVSFWRETKDPEGVQQDSPGRKPWVQGPNCGKP